MLVVPVRGCGELSHEGVASIRHKQQSCEQAFHRQDCSFYDRDRAVRADGSKARTVDSLLLAPRPETITVKLLAAIAHNVSWGFLGLGNCASLILISFRNNAISLVAWLSLASLAANVRPDRQALSLPASSATPMLRCRTRRRLAGPPALLQATEARTRCVTVAGNVCWTPAVEDLDFGGDI
jgi:hypothetical protein